jgi:CHAT domain-containing protein
MRPSREAGKERQDFLGLTTRVARWQMGESAMARPPQQLTVKRMVVVAPKYAGAMALNGAQAEAAALHTAAGFEEVRGDYTDFRALAANLPDGIIHFAGHGVVKEADGGAQYAILLEDGEVVPATWKELSSASTTHPFYFFNACEVGQAQQAVSALDGWGPALLESGASGYMGALWPVSDKAAGIFAGNFYQRMAANPGMPVAEVVRATRQQTYEQTHDATALAYVLYADPYLEVRR